MRPAHCVRHRRRLDKYLQALDDATASDSARWAHIEKQLASVRDLVGRTISATEEAAVKGRSLSEARGEAQFVQKLIPL